jgi:rSAM/selenodomain-associated transferase 2
MNETTISPELSIIVPVLNEAETLPALFHTLAKQEGILFELIISDGGSTDDTVGLARRLGKETLFPTTVVEGELGRGEQLNAGVDASLAATLLFIHADSGFTDQYALCSALDLLVKEVAIKGNEKIAGHFQLRFARSDRSPSFGYYYFECKARLHRRECTHGDQGFMLRRAFFAEAGPFDGSLPMLAETRFAETIRHQGEWLLFPVEIFTSARRFETEGLYERQVLNAIIMNFADQGWDNFFIELPSIYAGHDRSGPIALQSILRKINLLISALPLKKRLSLWYYTGGYVRSHAWQIPFFIDTLRNFRHGVTAGKGSSHLLATHDHFLRHVTDNLPGRLAAALLTWLWFRLTCIYFFIKRISTHGKTAG